MQDKIQKIVTQLSIEFNKIFDDFQGVYLYGLFSDFKEHPEEDIEFVAIFDKEDKEKREQIWRIIGKLEEKFDLFIDLTPTTMEELQKDEEFSQEVAIEGVFYNKLGVKKG